MSEAKNDDKRLVEREPVRQGGSYVRLADGTLVPNPDDETMVAREKAEREKAEAEKAKPGEQPARQEGGE